MSAPRVVLLILSWNRPDDILRCVASLSRLTYPNYVPVVIDNASRDDSVARIRQLYPHVQVIQNSVNLGYSAGNNVGLRWALQQDADYVQLINSDTEVTPDLISLLVEVAERDPRIGVVGCRNVLMEDPTRLWGAYGRLTYGPFVSLAAGQRALDGPAWQQVEDADWVIGNGYMWRRAALEKVGLLDEQFFGYHEDVDWCQRARLAGYRVVYVGTAAIVHKGGSSSDARERRRFPMHYFLGRNGILFVRKHANAWQKARFAVACGGAWAFRVARAGLLGLLPEQTNPGRRGMQLRAMEAAFSRGVVDALLRRPTPFDALGLTDAMPPGSGS
jgi:GT2 family glycosyltransferase